MFGMNVMRDWGLDCLNSSVTLTTRCHCHMRLRHVSVSDLSWVRVTCPGQERGVSVNQTRSASLHSVTLRYSYIGAGQEYIMGVSLGIILRQWGTTTTLATGVSLSVPVI